MGRFYDQKQIFTFLDFIRSHFLGAFIRTSFIVGFPGETDEDFLETISAVQDVGFDDAFMFKFSAREGTPATRLPSEMTVPDDVVDARFDELFKTVRGIARARNFRRVGERCEVLVEKEARKGELLQARSRDFKTVLIPGNKAMIGQYFHVELTGTTGSTFTGQLVRERAPLPVSG